MKTLPSFTVDWMIRRDLPEVLRIEAASFPEPWTEEDFLNMLRRSKVAAHAAHSDTGKVIGFALYELTRDDITVINFAVHPDFRRIGVGTHIMARLGARLKVPRPHVCMHLSDKNLNGHLFLRSLGFRAVKVLRGDYDNGDDAYRFRLTRRNA